jgi:hypothetical protein
MPVDYNQHNIYGSVLRHFHTYAQTVTRPNKRNSTPVSRTGQSLPEVLCPDDPEVTSDRASPMRIVLLAIIHCMNKHTCNVLEKSDVMGPLCFLSTSHLSNNCRQVVNN